MASPRRPTAQSPAPAAPESAGNSKNPRSSASGADEEERTTVDEERTTVDDGPPRGLRDRWEEKTALDRGAAMARRAASLSELAGADSVAGTIDRGLDARAVNRRPVDDQARPRPPLAVVPPSATDDVDDEDRPPTRAAINAKLTVIGGNDRGRAFPISTDKTTIGRGVDNNVVLTDIAVSRRHIVVEFDGNGFVVRDLSSGNGTIVNNQRMEYARLVAGDQLEIGNTLIRFECPRAAGSPGARRSGAGGFDDDEAATIAGRASPQPRRKMPLPPVSIVPINDGLVVAPSSAERRRKLMLGFGTGVGLILLIVGAAAVSGNADPANLAGVARDVADGEGGLDLAGQAPTVAPEPAPEPIAAVVAPEPAPEPIAAVVAPEPIAAVEKKDPPRLAKKQAAPKKTAPKKKRAVKKQTAPKKKRVATTRSVGKASSAKLQAAKKKAASQYKSKKFAAAVSTLRRIARGADDDTAARLGKIADDYEAVGMNLNKGNKTKLSNPPTALGAYRKALTIDRRAGKGRHGSYIRSKLGEVAPEAAASFMAQKRYGAAKRACDAAAAYGAGSDPMVSGVRKRLERKAAEFYKKGMQLRKKQPKRAKLVFERLLEFVPSDSPWYAKAYAANNANSRSRADGE